jgi:hypothetical protein
LNEEEKLVHLLAGSEAAQLAQIQSSFSVSLKSKKQHQQLSSPCG